MPFEVRSRIGSAFVSTVIFTCAGKRVDVVNAFREAGAFTVVAEMSAQAPAARAADAFEAVPAVADPAYVSVLASIVQRRKAHLILPLSDLDLSVLAEGSAQLQGIVLLPSPDVVAVTRDKWRTHEFLTAHGIDSPQTWLPDALPVDLPFPVLVKRRFGFGAEGLHWADSRDEIEFFLRYAAKEEISFIAPEVIVQEGFRDAPEFSIDVLGDRKGRCLNAIPRSMIESRGGESIKGMTIDDDGLVEHGRAIGEALGLVGPATIQCFRLDDGRLPVTDINTRFGGAFPLPTKAGSRFPELALAMAEGKTPEPSLGVYTRGVYMARYYTEVLENVAQDAPIEALVKP
jgi:carbamoyl-phosphate synthase large subunit